MTTTSLLESCLANSSSGSRRMMLRPNRLTLPFFQYRLGKGAVNIQSDESHARILVLDRLNGSSRAIRHLLIRAHSAARGGHVTSSGFQPSVCRRPARTFVLPAPRVPDGLTITPLPRGSGGYQGRRNHHA